MTKILSKKVAYQGKVININEYELDFENGNLRTFELINFNVETGVAALPIHQDKLILIKHYQLGIDDIGYSLPTGGLNSGEDPDFRMQEELQEEIGMKAGKLTQLSRINLLPSYIGGKPGYLYLAEDLKPSIKEGDEPYDIQLIHVKLQKAIDLIQSGEIQDSRTMLAILYYQQFIHP